MSSSKALEKYKNIPLPPDAVSAKSEDEKHCKCDKIHSDWERFKNKCLWCDKHIYIKL